MENETLCRTVKVVGMREACKLVGVPYHAVESWILRGLFEDVQRGPGGIRLFSPEDVERLRKFVQQWDRAHERRYL